MRRLQVHFRTDIYNLHDDMARGRLISLGSALTAAVYNAFITGIFYTGFLTMYDIPITGVGILTFIPFIANCFSLFSSAALERFRRRKWILLGAKIYFYAMYILAVTFMPTVVQEPQARLVWFGIIQFAAHAVYAVFSPGLTAWFYRFYPADNERRIRYIQLNQIFPSVFSSLSLVIAARLADAVSGTPAQGKLIIGMRCAAFVLVLLDVGMQACAREDTWPVAPKLRLSEIFTAPLRYRKFLCCMLLMFVWNFNSNLNNGLWSFHLLNHMHFSYTLINLMSASYTVLLVLLSPMWRRVLRRYSWIRTFGITNLLWVPTEITFFFMTPERQWIYIPFCLLQNILNIGFNLSYANVLYMNLPEENSTAHLAFSTIGCNVFAFLGLMTGTWLSGLDGGAPIRMLGMDVWAVQFTTLARSVIMLGIGLVCTRRWRSFTRDADIPEIEAWDRIPGARGLRQFFRGYH